LDDLAQEQLDALRDSLAWRRCLPCLRVASLKLFSAVHVEHLLVRGDLRWMRSISSHQVVELLLVFLAPGGRALVGEQVLGILRARAARRSRSSCMLMVVILSC
jgi:hypothetical protein